jgi:PBSX family phage terminase large subunit
VGLSARQWASIKHATGVVNLWDGSARAGKTTSANIAFLNYVRHAPPGHLAIIGKTLDTIVRNVLSPMKQLHPGAVKFRRRSTHCVILGREVELIGAGDAAAEERLRGLTLAGAYVDELTLMDEHMFQTLLGRLSGDHARLFATTNPDTPAHWLKRLYIDRVKKGLLPGWHVWRFTMDDNPGISEERKARYRREYTGLWYRRFYLGEWVAAEGAVFADWDPLRMVIPWGKLPTMQRLLGVGVDYGTNNPTAALLLGLGLDSRLYLVDEWRHDGRIDGRWTDTRLVKGLGDWMAQPHLPLDNRPGQVTRDEPPIEWIFVDPSAASLQAEMVEQRFGRLANADNKVLPGIQLMSSMLSTDRLKVADRCHGFIDEAPGYSWDPDQAAKGKDAVIKSADHSLDGGRYAIQSTHHSWRSLVRTV